MAIKRHPDDLAIFGGARLFASPKPVSNLVRPDFSRFMDYLDPALRNAQLTDGGPVCRLLERRLAELHEVVHCVAFISGFWALAILFRVLALPGRLEVVMPSLTYRRMSDIAAWAGLKPRFCEVDARTMTNGAEQVASCLSGDTALIMGVHPICGLADIEGLMGLAQEAGLPLIFDSVESVYERHLGRKIGGFGRAEVFSLGASKLINGFEGGYVTTNDAALAGALRAQLADRCAASAATACGLNAHLNELHAAMALASLDDLGEQITRNRARYLAYQQRLPNLPGIRLLTFNEADRPAYKNVLVEVTAGWPLGRDDTVRVLNAEGALARAYYPQPLHRKPMCYAHVPAQLPVTDDLAGRFVLLPCGELVEIADIDAIVDLLGFVAHHAGTIRTRLTAMEHRHEH